MIKNENMKWISNNISDGKYKMLKGETHSSYVIGNKKLAEIIIDEIGKRTKK